MGLDYQFLLVSAAIVTFFSLDTKLRTLRAQRNVDEEFGYLAAKAGKNLLAANLISDI